MILTILILVLALVGPAAAQSCGDTAEGFDSWKSAFAETARENGVEARGLDALSRVSYAPSTIAADRDQQAFRQTLDAFMELRGAEAIEAQGRRIKADDPGFYAELERRYGVPAGVLIAIHGLETAFGRYMGDSSVLSAIVTLTYDCRRSDYFRPHAIGALKLVDRGTITADTRGARHGELGHTQFLPGNALRYGVDGSGDGRVDLYDRNDALASTANYLRHKGWRRGAGYQTGEPNFRVVQAWSAAPVYQRAIATIAARIDR